jgi:hypothetical protein
MALFSRRIEDVDARHKAGHDERRLKKSYARRKSRTYIDRVLARQGSLS